jgi:hypothetical protein
MADIADIETINARVERDVEFRVQQRIKKFGKDGKRILGIHILVPIDKELEPFFKQPEHLEQEAKMKEDLFYTQKIIEKRDLDPELPPEVELPIKNTEVHMAKEKDTKTFNLTNVVDEDGDEPME